MDFTIYTLGDVESFRAALTAISMLFNSSNTEGWVSDGSDIGLGYMAALAILIGLTFMLFRGVYTLKFELGQLLVAIIVYAIMFVPKFSVNIEDYYTGVVQRVDDVPLGIALPGSVISTMTREITMQFNTAFSTVDGNYMSISSNGFLTPLKILNQLRYGSATLPQLDPNLATSLKWFLIDCTAGRPEFNENIIRSEKNPMTYLLTTAQVADIRGLTTYYNMANPGGRTVTCQDAITNITADLDTFYSGTSIGASTANPSGLSKFSRLLSMRTKGAKVTTNGGFTQADYEDAFIKLAGLSGDEAKAFAITSLTSGIITKARNCANSSSSEADLARCLPLIQASYQYEEDSAASGTMFQRTMLHSMSIMLFLFYCFAPIVALLILMLGQQGLKILGGYMIFGVWTQSWLPVATIINYFIQNKVSTEFAKFGGDPSRMMTISESPALYDMLSTNVAIASDLMAATPILSLALLTGSFFALTGVASRISGKDYYDEKVNSPAMVASAPVASNTTAFAGAMGTAMFSQSYGDGGGLNKSSAYTAMTQSTMAAQQSVQSGYRQEARATWDRMLSKSESAQAAWDEARAVGATSLSEFQGAYQRRFNLSDNEMQQLTTGQETSAGLSQRAAKETAGTVGARAGAGFGGIGIDKAPADGAAAGGKKGKIPFMPGLDMGASASLAHTVKDSEEARQSEERKAGTMSTQAQGDTREASSSGTRSTRGSTSMRDEVSNLRRVAENLEARYGSGFAAGLNRSLDRADTFMEQQQRIEQAASTVGTTGAFSAPELVNYLRSNDGFRDTLDRQSEFASMAYGQQFQNTVDSHYRAQAGTKLQALPQEDRERIAQLYALEQVDRQGFGAVMSALYADDKLASMPGSQQGTDARIDQARETSQERLSTLAAYEDRLPESGTVINSVGAQTGRVEAGIAGFQDLKNTRRQEGEVIVKGSAAQASAMSKTADYVADTRKHQVDPSYKDKREVLTGSVLAVAEKLPPELKQSLFEKHSALESYATSRGTQDGSRKIGFTEDTETRERLSKDFNKALGAAGAYIAKTDPDAYNKGGLARQIDAGKNAASDIARENRVTNNLNNDRDFQATKVKPVK